VSEREEFDDVERDGPWVRSKKAEQAMFALARRYRCSFDCNPGGAEFNARLDDGTWFRCQIGDSDDVSNLRYLRRKIAFTSLCRSLQRSPTEAEVEEAILAMMEPTR
jgi:hypothetical protein